MAAGSSHEAHGFREAIVQPVAASSAATGSPRDGPVSGDPEASPWDQAEFEAEREAAAILGAPPLGARSAATSATADSEHPVGGRPIGLFTAGAGLLVVLGMAIAVASATLGNAVPSERPRASPAALAPPPPAGAAATVPSSSSLSSSHPTTRPTPPPTPAVRTTAVRYHVLRGDTLTAIAARYKVTIAQIVQANRIPDPNLIYAGQTFVIPPPVQASP